MHTYGINGVKCNELYATFPLEKRLDGVTLIDDKVPRSTVTREKSKWNACNRPGTLQFQSAVNRVSSYLEFQIPVNFVSKGANLSSQSGYKTLNRNLRVIKVRNRNYIPFSRRLKELERNLCLTTYFESIIFWTTSDLNLSHLRSS